MSLPDFTSPYFEFCPDDSTDDVTVIRLTQSHLTDEDNINVFGNDLLNLVDKCDCQKIVVNAAAVVYVTSSVLGKLITLHRKLHRGDGRMILCCVGPEFMDVLETSRLHTYFTVCDTVAAAVALLENDEPDSKVG